MNPIPWILLVLPKKYRRYGYLILFILTTLFGLLLLISSLSQGNFTGASVVLFIIGLFLLGYWYGWKDLDKK